MSGAEPPVDYAVPADVPRSTRRHREPVAGGLWDGRARTALKIGCWGAAALLAVPLLVAVLSPAETGADSPEAAVERLLQGIADVDPVAVVAALAPDEVDDPDRLEAAYDRLEGRLERVGDVVPVDVALVTVVLENQVGGAVNRADLATLAAIDLDLTGLELLREPVDDVWQRVVITDGAYGIRIDPGRLPDSIDLGSAAYEMPLAEGWRAGTGPVEPSFVVVPVDGRWYVSLEATAADLFGEIG